MNFSELRDRSVEVLAEYDNRDAAGSTSARRNDSVILRRLKTVYHRILKRARQRNPRYFQAEIEFTYTANVRSVSLTSIAASSLRHADISYLGYVKDNDEAIPLVKVSQLEFEQYELQGSWPGSFEGQFAYHIVGDNLYVLPQPKSALSLRARYYAPPDLSAITTSNWASYSPDLLPEDLHELIAVEAALSFARELGAPKMGLEQERSELYQDLNVWATQDRSGGQRQVHEVY